MDEIKATVTEQLRQIQMLMYHRALFQHFMWGGSAYNRHRGQGRVLGILRMKPELSQRELTYLLNMSKQALAELLFKLEKSGYITREPSEEDKRVMYTHKWYDAIIKAILLPFFIDPAQGAEGIIELASAERVENGKLYSKGKIVKVPKRFSPASVQEELMRFSAEYLAKKRKICGETGGDAKAPD